MIEQYVVNILNEKSEPIKIQRLGELTDEFRAGRNPSELLVLLESNNTLVLDIALYILGEINIANTNILKQIAKRLKVLSIHKEPYIRYRVLLNLSDFVVSIDELNSIYKKMTYDLDKDISETAKKLLQNGHLEF